MLRAGWVHTCSGRTGYVPGNTRALRCAGGRAPCPHDGGTRSRRGTARNRAKSPDPARDSFGRRRWCQRTSGCRHFRCCALADHHDGDSHGVARLSAPKEFAGPTRVRSEYWAHLPLRRRPAAGQSPPASDLKIRPTQVPYKGHRAGPDLVSGQVVSMCDQIVNLVPQVKSNTIKAYAMALPLRSPALPDVPTTTEGAFPSSGERLERNL